MTSALDLPIERLKSGSSHGGDNGFLSSIISVAHNAANIINSDPRPSSPLHSLTMSPQISPTTSQKQSKPRVSTEALPVLNDGKLSVPLVAEQRRNSSSTNPTSLHTPGTSQEHLNDVQFEPLRDSPISTLGNGNLQLLHFEEKAARARSLTITSASPNTSLAHDRSVGAVKTDDNDPGLAQRLFLSGSLDNQVVKRKSFSNDERPSISQMDNGLVSVPSPDHTLILSDDNGSDLDHILDHATVTTASEKKNREFHLTFRKMPRLEALIDDFSCAISKDILVQGKMYLSHNYICFNSNILGWVTNLVIPLQEVIQIEKKSTAVLFPNGMIIRTLHRKYVFATFLSRDTTFNLITKVWHMSLQTGEVKPQRKKLRRGRSRSSKTGSSDADHTSINMSDDAQDSNLEVSDDTSRTSSRSDLSDLMDDGLDLNLSLSDSEGDKKSGNFNGFSFPGPSSHAPTSHKLKTEAGSVDIIDHTFSAPIGVVFNLLFGPEKGHYVRVLENQKNYDILTDSITELSNSKTERKYVYTKPLSGPIGPKLTKCNIVDSLLHCDFEDYVEVEEVTQTPDVPSGNAFKVRTTFLFTWAPSNSTKMFVTTSIEWSAKSWIKSAIEKGSIDGQKSSMKSLVTTLTDIITSGGENKIKRKKTKSVSRPAPPAEPAPPPEQKPPPGLQEQISNLLAAIGGAIPIQIPGVSEALLGGLILVIASFIYTWFLAVIVGRSISLSNIRVKEHVNPFTGLVEVDEKAYYVFPLPDTFLGSRVGRNAHEATIWDWISERTNGQVAKSTDSASSQYTQQEFEEIVRLARLRVNSLYERIN